MRERTAKANEATMNFAQNDIISTIEKRGVVYE